MIITSASLSMQASYEHSMQTSVSESTQASGGSGVAVTVSGAALSAQNSGVVVEISAAGRQQALTQTSAAATANAGAADDNDSGLAGNPRLLAIKQLLEEMTGKKINLFDPGQLQHGHRMLVSKQQITYSQTQTTTETQQTTLQTSGEIKTADGKDIKISQSLAMRSQTSVSSTSQVQISTLSLNTTDPLMINYNGNGVQLSDRKMAFDLKGNGGTEQISVPQAGSGFLVLDKNNDGKITSGSQLFGPATGNGFAELAQYDVNHKGWIDASDPAYNQLKVWTPDGNGGGTLQSLATLGIGAISLQSAATPFDIKGASGQTLGSVSASGIALNENGTVDNIQDVNLVTS
ncbi:hypothetical protein RP726_09685 [Candidatus Methylospira mobilis]|uniref:hypothetical protein n=1 Tax=Candidatus Methylospira mobilis TaxID=1808979 RepID=UPI0028E5873D|nr:hypothetical protein [Candidatus Methylospira mobilis]WNV06657.1 hypothetical protein RP726_09685 [Candidatus Methylospira mobilis]